MKPLYFVLWIISLVILSPLGAVEKTDGQEGTLVESKAVSDTNLIATENAVVDTSDPIIKLQIEAEEKIEAIIDRVENLEDKTAEPELLKEIERIKMETEIDILKIRLERARETASIEYIVELETAIDNLENTEKYWPKGEKTVREYIPTYNEEMSLKNNLPPIDQPRKLEAELSQRNKEKVTEPEEDEEAKEER